MKEQDLHSVLWQKRNELRITDDVQHDWMDMHTLLDAQMPVANLPAGSPGAGGLSGLSGFKLLSVLLTTLGTATLIYFASHKNVSEKSNSKKNTTAVATTKADSVSKAATQRDDSLSTTMPSANSEGNGATRANPDKNTNSPANTNPDKNAASPTNASSRTTANNPLATPNNNAANAKLISTGIASSGNKAGNTTISSAKTNGSTVGDNKSTVSGTRALSGNNPIGGRTHHLINGTATTANKGNSAANTASSVPRSSILPNTSHSYVKNTRPGAHLGSPGTRAVSVGGSNGRANLAGNGLGRHARNRSPHLISPPSGNSLAKSKSSHSSHQAKNNPLTRNGNPASNSISKNTGFPQNTDVDTSSRLKNNTDQNAELDDAVYAKFVADGYIPPFLSPAMVAPFKDVQNGSQTGKLLNNKPSGSNNASKLEFGILTGVNTAGSFTAKSQNANFYGSFPIDGFFGLFTTYYFNDKWGVDLGIRGLSPQTVSGTYSHSNDSKIDTLQTLNMSDSRKVYFVDVPLNLVFKPTPYLRIKAGAVFSLPVKQANGISTFQTGKLKKDSIYYVKVTQTINATNYTQSVNIGLTGGVSAQAGRFVFDAAYIRGLKGLTVGSALGNYTINSNYLLFSVGFKLKK